MPTDQTESTTETYVVNYYITINFNENCGVEKVIIKQTGKPKEDDPPTGCGSSGGTGTP